MDLQESAHQVVDHAEQYVDGKVHTNGLENFWSLLKRGLNGTYVSLSRFIFSATLTNKYSVISAVPLKTATPPTRIASMQPF